MKRSRNIYPILLILISIFFSCDKEYDYEAQEIEMIEDFMLDRGYAIEPTESGLYFKDIVVGTGESPVPLDTVVVDYTGYFLDGRMFDTSAGKDPFKFTIENLPFGDVILGWDEGLQLMKVGGEAILIIPSWLAYGPNGSRSIPGYTPLFFEVELLEIIPGPNK